MTSLLKPRAERRTGDAYFTPGRLASAIVGQLDAVIPAPESVLEPSAGAGAFLLAVNEQWPSATTVGIDIQPQAYGITKADFLDGRKRDDYDLVVGNPPYQQAEAFVRAALDGCRPGGWVAFLLRLSFLASQRRAPLFCEHPLRYLVPIAGRPSFTGDGRSDASEYGLFVWGRGFSGRGELLPPLEWKDAT